MVQIFLDTGRGFNGIEEIKIPISPTETAYTYTFPLADAPLIGLRLEPFEHGAGALTITNFRIINRRNEEIRRFARTEFQPSHQIAGVEAVPGGWKVVTAPNANGPYSDIRLARPIVAEGMNHRNFQRCLLSWGYLSMMIWILLLAVYFALRPFTTARAMLRSCAFLLFLALLFSAVGNRGLIEEFGSLRQLRRIAPCKLTPVRSASRYQGTHPAGSARSPARRQETARWRKPAQGA